MVVGKVLQEMFTAVFILLQMCRCSVCMLGNIDNETMGSIY